MLGVVLALLMYRDDAIAPLLDDALAALSQAVGFREGWVGRSPDQPDTWVLGSRWDDAGALRRGLGSYAAKMALGPLQAYSTGEDVVVEILTTADGDRIESTPSARADDADTAHPGSGPDRPGH